MEERKRSVLSVDGAGGFLVAVLLLLSILAFLVYNAAVVQSANAENFYDIKDPKSIQMISTDNSKHLVDAK